MSWALAGHCALKCAKRLGLLQPKLPPWFCRRPLGDRVKVGCVLQRRRQSRRTRLRLNGGTELLAVKTASIGTAHGVAEAVGIKNSNTLTNTLGEIMQVVSAEEVVLPGHQVILDLRRWYLHQKET
jgi:hypothetical protein